MIRLSRVFLSQRFNPSDLKSLVFTRDVHQSQVFFTTPEDEENKKKKKNPKIALVGVDNKLSYSTLEEATKMSTRRNLKLVKLTDFDAKRECAVYQLIAGWQSRTEDLKSKLASKKSPSGFKSEKIIVISNKIFEHDLESKIKSMLKLIEKNHEVRVTISGAAPNEELSETIYKKIESKVGSNGRILQKRSSGNDVKFQIIPPRKPSDAKSDGA